MSSGRRNKGVRNIVQQQFFMQLFIDLIKEVIDATAENKVQGTRSEEMGVIYNAMVFPTVWMFGVCAQDFGNIPFFWEGSQIDPAAHASRNTEYILMFKRQKKGAMSAHAKSCYCAASFVFYGVVMGVDPRD